MPRFTVLLLTATMALAACDTPSDFGRPPGDPSAVRLGALRSLLLEVREAGLDRIGDIRADALEDLGLSLRAGADGTEFPEEYVGTVLRRDPATLALEPDLASGPDNGVRVRTYARDVFGDIIVPLQVVGYMDFTDEDDAGAGPAVGIEAEMNGLEAFSLLDHAYEPQSIRWLGTIGALAATTLSVEAGPAPGEEFSLDLDVETATDDRATLALVFSTAAPAVTGTLELEARTTLADAAGFGLLLVDADLAGVPGAVTVTGSADLTVTTDNGGWQFFHRIDIAGPLATPTFTHADGDPLLEVHITAMEAYWDELVRAVRSVTGAQGLPSPLP